MLSIINILWPKLSPAALTGSTFCLLRHVLAFIASCVGCRHLRLQVCSLWSAKHYVGATRGERAVQYAYVIQ
jgi:hypothetical protein